MKLTRQQIESEINDIIDEHYDCDGGAEAAHIIADKVEEWVSGVPRSKETPDSYLVDNFWRLDLASMIGRFEVAPTESAKKMWEVVKKNPKKYQFTFSYMETDKSQELVGISLTFSPHEARI